MLCVACKVLKHVILVWELVLVPSAGYDQAVKWVLVQGTTSLIRVGLTTIQASIPHSCHQQWPLVSCQGLKCITRSVTLTVHQLCTCFMSPVGLLGLSQAGSQQTIASCCESDRDMTDCLIPILYSSGCIHNNTRNRKSSKNSEGLGKFIVGVILSGRRRGRVQPQVSLNAIGRSCLQRPETHLAVKCSNLAY